MSVFSRRKFLVAALGSAACGGAEMAPVWTPKGVSPFDPRQPKVVVPVPQKFLPKNPIYTSQSPASPVHLSASVVLPSGSNGTVPAAALKNPMGQDMEILEVKFEISGPYGDGRSNEVWGGTIWCELVMGSHKLTNGSVPVWNFGRAENVDRTQQVDGTDDLSFVAYSWRLPRPLFVPAGAVVVPNFTHTGLVSEAVNVRIGYSARTVFARPKKIYVPWVAKYVSKSFNPMNDAGTDSSTELDLVNPNTEVLHLQRFVGRTLTVGSEGILEEAEPGYFGSQTLLVRMTDSYGRPVVRSFTPFRDVFTPLTRSWELDNGADLDPEAFYRVDLKVNAITLDPGQANASNASAQAFISMVGWRELETF